MQSVLFFQALIEARDTHILLVSASRNEANSSICVRHCSDRSDRLDVGMVMSRCECHE